MSPLAAKWEAPFVLEAGREAVSSDVIERGESRPPWGTRPRVFTDRSITSAPSDETQAKPLHRPDAFTTAPRSIRERKGSLRQNGKLA